MNDVTPVDDQVVRTRLRELVDAAVEPRDPMEVAEHAFAQVRPAFGARSFSRLTAGRAALAGLAVLVLSVGAVGYFVNQQGASRLASAIVNEHEYTLAAARSLRVAPEMLTPYGQVTRIDPSVIYEGLTVYSIRGVDPEHALLIRLAPGQRDDAGPLGEYFLLVRGPDAFADLCPFFEKTSEATPRECR